MKRSEVIRKMAEAISLYEQGNNMSDEEILADEKLIQYNMDLADIALAVAEKAGMVPPKPIIKFENGTEHSTIRFYLMIGWDKEDDKETVSKEITTTQDQSTEVGSETNESNPKQEDLQSESKT